MDPILPSSPEFKMLSFSLSVLPFTVLNIKICIIITVNVILLLMEAIMQYTLRQDIFAYVGKPVLMVLDTVQITGTLFAHAVLVLESLIKRRVDLVIWTKINDINKKSGSSSTLLDKTFMKDFALMTIVPLIVQIGVILATYRSQKNWALALISRQWSGVINRWCILAFIYYMRYMSDRFLLMTQEINQLIGLTRIYKDSSYVIFDRLHQMKASFNMIWHLHCYIKNRYEIFLVSYIFLMLCALTSSTYFLTIRLITRRFDYTIESALCLVPFLYTNIHMSVVAADFGLNQSKLLNALESLSEQNWRSPEVLSAITSFKIQIQLSKLIPTVGGHLRVQYSSMVMNVVYIVTTYIFIFMFLN